MYGLPSRRLYPLELFIDDRCVPYDRILIVNAILHRMTILRTASWLKSIFCCWRFVGSATSRNPPVPCLVLNILLQLLKIGYIFHTFNILTPYYNTKIEVLLHRSDKDKSYIYHFIIFFQGLLFFFFC
jgi:hypothetical protein